MKQLLAFILTFFLAFPAIAMPMSHDMGDSDSKMVMKDCHGQPGAPSQSHDTGQDHDTSQKSVGVKSDCIGCAAPTGLSRVATPHQEILRPTYSASEIRFAVAAASAPEPPPPRQVN